MKNRVVALGALLLVCWSQPSLAISSGALTHERIALLAAILESWKDNPDNAALTTSLRRILDNPAFSALSNDERHAAYILYGTALYNAADWANAQMPIKIASEMSEGDAFDWSLRLSNDIKLHDYDDGVPAATNLAQKWPEKLIDYNDHTIFVLVYEAGKRSPKVQSDFLEALHEMRWKPKSEFSTADSAWLALIRVRLTRGDVAGAKAIALELRDPTSIISLQIDNRFDDIVRGDPEQFDVMKAYGSLLADMKSKSAAAPDELEGVNTVAADLIVMLRPDEALSLVSAALERLRADPKAYSDAEDLRNWTEDFRSRALFDLGRSDEAFAALKAGAALKDGERVNVSQSINLAERYNDFERPKEALEAVSAIELSDASGYGRMALHEARACAYFALGDTINLNKSLDYMRAHKNDGTQPYLEAMLFTGNNDDAAAEVIAALNDPTRRTGMLGFLQDYARNPYPTKRTAAVHDAWIAIRNRPDVAAEIAKVGHINEYALRLPTY